jgi:cardiolipin synthase
MELFWQIVYYAFTALYVYIALVVLTAILLENRNPVKTLGWIMIMILLPIVGIVLYVFLGQDLRRRKVFANKLRFPNLEGSYVGNDKLQKFGKVATLLTETAGARVLSGNKVEVFTTGEDAFNSLCDDIERATNHIHVEFYIIENDKLGNRFRELLERKAREGVRVRVIYDYLGGWNLPIVWRLSLKEAGAFIHPFLPADNFFRFTLLNYRNHRKLVVIDGRVAYTGGMNLAERYLSGNRLGLWRDTFVRVEGLAVHAMQYSFLVDWSFVDGKVVTDKKYYPDLSCDIGDEKVQVVTSGPDSDWRSIMQGIVVAISNAKKEVLIHTPYCMPPESVMNALETAALSGVRVRVMIPERNDAKLVAAAGRSYIEALLRAGVEVFYYRKNFLHSKAIVVDGYLSIVGTANMDHRSYEQNFEIAAFVYGEKTARCLVEGFERDMESSRQLNVNLWRHRKWYKRYVESLARLISPLL